MKSFEELVNTDDPGWPLVSEWIKTAKGKNLGNIYYFSPDGLEYEALDITYSQFLDFCFNKDLNVFYKGLRWDNWKADVKKIDGNQVFNFVPALWTIVFAKMKVAKNQFCLNSQIITSS
ncbi:DUF2625 family protein [Pedobacter sp. MC2016-24]|uniref:DUF2625 family protein n=1 Tax=Pedobacter sp. MC2016-24 TaxID=2780090 RepID=UPI00187FE1AD|nr:DUF2625 family protein [Pedobacter sp. MC2016-24]MBE9601917.1 DUF2625 family protein [Pedobacter sp. MC2016-24]